MNIFGKAEISPEDEVVAGSCGTWSIIYTAGDYGIDAGGNIKISIRNASDWSRPQFDNPTEDNYLSVSTDGKAKLKYCFQEKGNIRPWQPSLIITAYDNSLKKGETVTVVYGDRSKGSRGSRAQTFPESSFEFSIWVDPFGTRDFVRLDHSPELKIIGGNAVCLKAVVPSQAEQDQPFTLLVKAEDMWGNPSPSYRGRITVSSPNCTGCDSYSFTPRDRGVHRFEGLKFNRPGIYRVEVIDMIDMMDKESKMKAESNPICCVEKHEKYSIFWGDIHGQTEETIGTGSLREYFSYARDVAAIDFVSHCGNDFQITKEHWKDTQDVVKEYHEPGRFITFLGYEWSGTTPAGGDRNVYFLKDDQPIYRSSHWLIKDKSDEDTDRHPISELYKTFKGRDDVLIIPHIGGRRANLDFHEPELEPLIEVYSVHGVFEWFIREAMERKLKVGFIASSDDHSGRQGAAYPGDSETFCLRVRGGLVAALTEELTRKGIWEALKNRRCYGTSGERIILNFSSGNHSMGSEFVSNAPPKFQVKVIGTDFLEKVEIARGLEVVYSFPVACTDKISQEEVKIVWSGAGVKCRGRFTRWDGTLTLDRGRILSCRTYAFDNPAEGITETSEKSISWRSTTAGDEDGIVLKLDTDQDAVITFTAGPKSFSLSLKDIGRIPRVFEAGGIDQKVSVFRPSSGKGQKETSFEWTDENIPSGLNPYYLKVKQTDGSLAWSSPIFISFDKQPCRPQM